MIQLTRKTLAPAPTVLNTTGVQLTLELMDAYDQNQRAFEFAQHVYAHAHVKNSLIRIQNYKCCFCESFIGHIDDGDVEHFRPKKGWMQHAGDQITRPGYYWLAYAWDNLFLACRKCNQRNKKNLFPLLDPTTRVVSHHGTIANEQPVYLHPSIDVPEQHIGFDEEHIKSLMGSNRGQETIGDLKLDRSELNQIRSQFLSTIKTLYDVVDLIPAGNQIRIDALTHLKAQYDEKTIETGQFAGMFRAFFAKHPVPTQ